MSRDLTVAFATALADQSLRPVIFFEGQFATGWVRIWSGLGEVSWNGQAWAGAGSLLGLGAIDETGEVVAGNVGHASRFEYTVIGDAVNSAARLTDLAKDVPGHVLVARSSVDRALGEEASYWRSDGELTLRGRATPTPVSILVGSDHD